ncbi:hypothetical protein, partial [Vibrio campbellii]|uniref:hypothetical protein n=1 Tax=Vibrio campbellii TaxID=680 RepID=UPI001D128C66
RTEVHGFAIRCIATLPRRLICEGSLTPFTTLSSCALGYGMHSTDSSDRVNTIFIFLNRLTRICAKDGKLISFNTENIRNTLVYHEYWATPLTHSKALFLISSADNQRNRLE